MEEKYEFCLNSRRWICMLMIVPHTCAHENEQLLQCQSCGYYSLRKPTTYLLERLKIIRSIGDK
jgi:hypothetical protein